METTLEKLRKIQKEHIDKINDKEYIEQQHKFGISILKSIEDAYYEKYKIYLTLFKNNSKII